MVTIGGFASNGSSFTVTPAISSLSPSSGPIGTSVTITGTTFGASQGASTVTFNGTAATPTSWSDTSIALPVPEGATTGSVVVTVGGVATSGITFTVTSPGPTISSLNPSSAAVGTLIQIAGENLSVPNQQTTVNLGSLQFTGSAVASSDPTSVYFVVPPGATSGAVTVQVNGLTSNSVSFTLLTPPQISSLAPLEIDPGSLLTVQGVNFGASGASGNSLLIDGQQVATSSWSNTQVTVQAPSGTGTHMIAVVSGGDQSTTLQFTVLSYGTISGTVTANGLPVPGANVQGAAGQSAITDSGGNFSFSTVPVGTYSVGASASGYVPSVASSVIVNAGATTSVQISVAIPNPTQINIIPNNPTITVGGGQNLTLVDQNGMPVTGATWSVDDSTVAFFDTTNNSMTGVAIGSTTVRASWQGYQASASVNVIASGNVLWSSQLSAQIAPGTPVLQLAKTGTGPDYVYTDGSNLYGVSYESGIVWQQYVPGISFFFSRAAADENGDFVVPVNGPSGFGAMTKFYGANGLPKWTRSIPFSDEFAVDSQGNVFQLNEDDLANYYLQELSSSSGQILRSVALPGVPSQIYVLSDDSVQVQYGALIPDFGSGPLHLVTLSGTSVSDVVLDGTINSWTASSGTDVVSGPNLPDGNGGTLNVWSEVGYVNPFGGESYDTAASKVLFQDSATGLTFQSNGIAGAYQFVLGSTGILYFVGSQYGCSSPSGYCGDALVAMNLSTGTEAWRIQLDSSGSGGWSGQEYGNPSAATSDGGLILTASTASGVPTSGAARVDTNGNVTTDSDLSSYLPFTGDYQSDLIYLGGPDGTLWASTASSALISSASDLDSTSGDIVSDWPAPSGEKNSSRGAKSAQFQDSDTSSHCGGFDGYANPHVLVVPVNGTNQVILQVKGAWQNVTLQSDTASVTVSPAVPTGKKTTLTVTGGTTPTLARIKVVNNDGSHLATLRVAVKAATAPVVVDLYPVVEANENLTPTVPASADVLGQYQKSFGKHANIPFTVNSMSAISVAYDLNGDRMLAYTGQNFSANPEALTINNYLSANGANQSHKFIAYVNQITPLSPTIRIEGFGDDPLGFVQNQTASGQPYVTAHETGHILKLDHYHGDEQDVMTSPDPGNAPCRLHVDEWNQLNPTGDSMHPAQWEMAPHQPEDD
ncbi:MAG TPA: IPT/TIG domain-containing protein [Candidatus Sulfotelmatobacter sp.]|nr:IPT/TIG domain-containing protein [Candidatus Sulfotelmatobacter sp.]